MTAKQLEEFIGVIETAERLAHKENIPGGKSTASSSLWSYPTDIFTPRRSPRGVGSSTSPSSSPLRVRRLQDKGSPTHHQLGTSERPQVR